MARGVETGVPVPAWGAAALLFVAVIWGAWPALTDDSASTGGSEAIDLVVALEEREGLDPGAARCVDAYVREEYDTAEVGQLASAGITGLPIGRWGGFGNAVLACQYGDELGVAGDPPFVLDEDDRP